MEGMALIPPGTFRMGSAAHYPEEAPVRRVAVEGFWIDRCQVTNRRFAEFAQDTGYVTVAERPLDPNDFPGAPPENLVPGSLAFRMTGGSVDRRHLNQWWTWTPGASWRHPEGRRSSIAGREDEPVVHIAYEDAEAYAAWAGKALPTEAQWERAARGGLDGATPEAPCCVPTNPHGGRLEDSYDPSQPQFRIPRKVIKGGSYLCADSYCVRYRPAAARRPHMIDTGMSHIGFRCVRGSAP
jgi:formylglycine-generating enzyme